MIARALFFLILSTMVLPQGLSAVQVKVSLPIPVATSHIAEGFDNSTLYGPSDFGLKVLTPVAQDTLMGLGISLFRARVVDGEEVASKYTGVLEATMFKLGVEYSGIELFTDYQLVLELTVDFPTGGPGRVEDANGDEVSSATSVSGSGYYASTAIRWGHLEGGFFLRNNHLNYGEMTIPERDPNKEISLNFTSYGIVLSYLF